jgi:hypothetical protein
VTCAACTRIVASMVPHKFAVRFVEVMGDKTLMHESVRIVVGTREQTNLGQNIRPTINN